MADNNTKNNNQILEIIIEYIRYKMIIAQNALTKDVFEGVCDSVSIKKFIYTYNSFNIFRSNDKTQNKLIDISKQQYLEGNSRYVELTEKEIDDLLSLISLYFEKFGFKSIEKSFEFDSEKEFLVMILNNLKEKVTLSEVTKQANKWILYLSAKNSSAFLDYLNPKITYNNNTLSLTNSDGVNITENVNYLEQLFSADYIYVCNLVKTNNDNSITEQLKIMTEIYIGDNRYFIDIVDQEDQNLYSDVKGGTIVYIESDIYDINKLYDTNTIVNSCCCLNDYLNAMYYLKLPTAKACYNRKMLREIFEVMNKSKKPKGKRLY